MTPDTQQALITLLIITNVGMIVTNVILWMVRK
jgi:hypothetical protein